MWKRAPFETRHSSCTLAENGGSASSGTNRSLARAKAKAALVRRIDSLQVWAAMDLGLSKISELGRPFGQIRTNKLRDSA